jgi:predicted DNA-binding protein (MmcQ/YjbR family)
VSSRAEVRRRLLAYALSLPEAAEDHPWGETVVKVRSRIFVFGGVDGSPTPIVGVKLSASHPLALAQAGVQPTGYNLGKSGWVTVAINDETPYEMLREWIDESYRAVAPKRLLKQHGWI